MNQFMPARPKGQAPPRKDEDEPPTTPLVHAQTNGAKPAGKRAKPPAEPKPAGLRKLGELEVLEGISMLLSNNVASKKRRRKLLEIAARMLQ